MQKMEFEKLVQAARSANLAAYFRQSGYTLKQHGADIYIAEFPGLCVKESTNQWYCHYSATGRTNNSLDCLTEIVGLDFKTAVHALTGQDVSQSPCLSYSKYPYPTCHTPPRQKPKAEFKLPEHAANMRRVFAYICKERKIPAEVVSEFARAKLLYQSQAEIVCTINSIPQTFKKVNAIFVHFNENGEAIGGEVQGVTSLKRFKGLVAGTGDSFFVLLHAQKVAETARHICLSRRLT
jgi:hypothetical protein